MPRASISTAAKIVNFFRSASLETADLILDLCRDAVGERKAKSSAAKVRATRPAVALAPPSAVPSHPAKRRKKPGPKKGSRRKAAATTETEPELPLVEEYGEEVTQ